MELSPDQVKTRDILEPFMEDFVGLMSKHGSQTMPHDVYVSLCASVLGSLAMHLTQEDFYHVLKLAFHGRQCMVDEIMKNDSGVVN